MLFLSASPLHVYIPRLLSQYSLLSQYNAFSASSLVQR